MFYWSWLNGRPSVEKIATELSVSRKTVSRVFKAVDEVMAITVNRVINRKKIGGLGKYVVMDESFGLHPKVSWIGSVRAYKCLAIYLTVVLKHNLYRMHN